MNEGQTWPAGPEFKACGFVISQPHDDSLELGHETSGRYSFIQVVHRFIKALNKEEIKNKVVSVCGFSILEVIGVVTKS